MLRCVVNTNALRHETLDLPPEEAHHVARVLRAQVGDFIELLDGQGGVARGIISRIQAKNVSVNILERDFCKRPLFRIALFPALLKTDPMDWLIQKATEIGVSAIYPILTERSIARINSSDLKKKKAHWLNISRASIKQCGNRWLPEICSPQPFLQSIGFFSRYEKIFIGALGIGAKSFRSVLQGTNNLGSAGCCIGPEGDFTEKEINILREQDVTLVSLGVNTLRAETAGLYMCSILAYSFL